VSRLRSYNPRCPKCDYSLRGLSRPMCPECGADLSKIGIYLRGKPTLRSLGARGLLPPILALILLIAGVALDLPWLPRRATLEDYHAFVGPKSGSFRQLTARAYGRGTSWPWPFGDFRARVERIDLSMPFVIPEIEVESPTRSIKLDLMGPPLEAQIANWIRGNTRVKSASIDEEAAVVAACLRSILAGGIRCPSGYAAPTVARPVAMLPAPGSTQPASTSVFSSIVHGQSRPKGNPHVTAPFLLGELPPVLLFVASMIWMGWINRRNRVTTPWPGPLSIDAPPTNAHS